MNFDREDFLSLQLKELLSPYKTEQELQAAPEKTIEEIMNLVRNFSNSANYYRVFQEHFASANQNTFNLTKGPTPRLVL